MKKVTVIIILICMLLMVTGCGRMMAERIEDDIELSVSDCVEPDRIVFSSLEEFLTAHRKVRAGGDLRELAETVNYFTSLSDVDFASVAENAGFTGLETLHLPTGIPESYQLYEISINEVFIFFWFLPNEYMVSEETARGALARNRGFNFVLDRTIISDSMEDFLQRNRVTENDLINGKFLFIAPNTFIWQSNGQLMFLNVPFLRADQGESINQEPNYAAINSGIVGVEVTSISDLLRLTETMTVDLTNDTAVAELLEATRR